MFTAAETAGTATRPLLIFYGLSQAGRSIAAASKSVGQNDWRLQGHGIGVDQSSLTGGLAKIHVYADHSNAGSFVRLSKILGSPTWSSTEPVILDELWNSLPQGTRRPLLASPSSSPSLAFDVGESWSDPGGTPEPFEVLVSPIPESIVSTVPLPRGSSSELEQFLSPYPSLAGYLDAVRFFVGPEFGVKLQYPSASADRDQRYREALERGSAYLGSYLVFPAVGKNAAALHPLMTWWAILYVLSILARYHPDEWARHIAVDRSSAAVPLEGMLEAALYVVPHLIAQTVEQVST
jgi:hypothetical protein